MTLNPELVLTILGASFLLLTLLEWAFSKWKKMGFYKEEYLLVNLSLASLQQISGLLYQLVFFAGYFYVQTNVSIQQLFGFAPLATGWPISFQNGFQIHWLILANWLIVLVMADFCQYWLHRLSHEVNILWAGHIVHHSNTEYNYGVAVRQSFLEGFYTWIFYLPLAVAGIPWELFISAYALSLFWQFFVHTRMVEKMGIFEIFMATPSHHRAHHGKNDIYLDKNYGALFIIWDKLFGTFQEETEAVQYGITVPLEHNNLLWINTHHHIYIGKMVLLAQDWKEKLKVIFGWPSYISKGMSPVDVFEKPHLFSKQSEKRAYVYVSFVLTSIAGLYWMNTVREHLSFLDYAAVAIVLGSNLIILTGLLEDLYWANVAEVTKLCLMLGTGIFLYFQMASFIGIGLFIYAISALIITYALAKSYKKTEVYS